MSASQGTANLSCAGGLAWWLGLSRGHTERSEVRRRMMRAMGFEERLLEDSSYVNHWRNNAMKYLSLIF